MQFFKKNAAGANQTAKEVSVNTTYTKQASHSRPQRILRYRFPDGAEREVRGKEARVLEALVKAGRRGVTALELSSWALRLAAYVHGLRHEYGLPISMRLEPHIGGFYGRYVLEAVAAILVKSYGKEG